MMVKFSGAHQWVLFREPQPDVKTMRVAEQKQSSTKNLNRLDTIWQFLPPDVRDAIVKKVPLEELLKWRLVSKNWNTMIMSERPSWCSMEMGFLQAVFSSDGRTLTDCGYLTGSRTGLLFMICTFQVKLDVQTSILVCNPITKEHKEIRVPDQRRKLKGHAWLIQHDEKPDSEYNLLMTYRGESQHLLYSSSTNSWREVRGPELQPNCIFSAVTSNGRLFLLKGPRFFDVHVRPTLGFYDPSDDTWGEYTEVPTHIGPDRPQLIETGGRLLYVARTFTTEKNSRGGRLSWCMYEVEEREPSSGGTESFQWGRVREMPRDVYVVLNPAIPPVYREVRSFGEGNNIFFVGLECTSLNEGDSRGVKVSVVVHDFRLNSWTWIPAFRDEHASFWYQETNSVRVLSFLPSLTPVN
ncbi:hypothetical protein R1sor_025510 [Riccia sorocarpa]|uniref:F-box domain-containing protein n=1 Tax=Riccia sorocarpa TaxID=122646 RepID=A0ABD3GBK2_9MARC